VPVCSSAALHFGRKFYSLASGRSAPQDEASLSAFALAALAPQAQQAALLGGAPSGGRARPGANCAHRLPSASLATHHWSLPLVCPPTAQRSRAETHLSRSAGHAQRLPAGGERRAASGRRQGAPESWVCVVSTVCSGACEHCRLQLGRLALFWPAGQRLCALGTRCSSAAEKKERRPRATIGLRFACTALHTAHCSTLQTVAHCRL